MQGFSILRKTFQLSDIESITVSNKRFTRVAPSTMEEVYTQILTIRVGIKDYNFTLDPKSDSNKQVMDAVKDLSKSHHFTVYDDLFEKV